MGRWWWRWVDEWVLLYLNLPAGVEKGERGGGGRVALMDWGFLASEDM